MYLSKLTGMKQLFFVMHDDGHFMSSKQKVATLFDLSCYLGLTGVHLLYCSMSLKMLTLHSFRIALLGHTSFPVLIYLICRFRWSFLSHC